MFPELEKRYSKETLSAREAQRFAEFIAWSPVVFQVSRLMIKFNILSSIRDSENGLTINEIVDKTKLSEYSVKCLMDASLSIGTVLIDVDSGRYTISKIGWFLLTDPATMVNINFNHHINYNPLYYLEESLINGKPEGLKCFGDWDSIYPQLSSLPNEAQKSWFDFDHFYSDSSFPEAIKIVFEGNNVGHIYDFGGNTGKWALKCVEYNNDVRVTICDLPQQVSLMKKNIKGKVGEDRIDGFAINFLDTSSKLPEVDGRNNVIWMSQFLDCFSIEQIIQILKVAKKLMSKDSVLYIMELLWDRQRFEPAAFCLNMTSLYFAAVANGCSKMYSFSDMEYCIKQSGLVVKNIYDNLGHGHSIIKCVVK